MSRALTKIAYCVCIASSAAVLAGCAETYPSLPGLPSANERLLTPSQQQQTIKDIGGNVPGQAERPDSGVR